MTSEGRALSFFSQMRSQVAEIDGKIAVVSAHRERLVASRDRKNGQISLSPREQRMHQNKIDAAEAQLLRLVQERSRLTGDPVKAPFGGQEES